MAKQRKCARQKDVSSREVWGTGVLKGSCVLWMKNHILWGLELERIVGNLSTKKGGAMASSFMCGHLYCFPWSFKILLLYSLYHIHPFAQLAMGCSSPPLILNRCWNFKNQSILLINSKQASHVSDTIIINIWYIILS